jgi:hypothetical protein
MKTKEEIIEPFIWKDNNGNPRIAIMDCLNAMEIYADQFKQAGINTVLCTVASEGQGKKRVRRKKFIKCAPINGYGCDCMDECKFHIY